MQEHASVSMPRTRAAAMRRRAVRHQSPMRGYGSVIAGGRGRELQSNGQRSNRENGASQGISSTWRYAYGHARAAPDRPGHGRARRSGVSPPHRRDEAATRNTHNSDLQACTHARREVAPRQFWALSRRGRTLRGLIARPAARQRACFRAFNSAALHWMMMMTSDHHPIIMVKIGAVRSLEVRTLFYSVRQ